jgi:hypothetical protein
MIAVCGEGCPASPIARQSGRPSDNNVSAIPHSVGKLTKQWPDKGRGLSQAGGLAL